MGFLVEVKNKVRVGEATVILLIQKHLEWNAGIPEPRKSGGEKGLTTTRKCPKLTETVRKPTKQVFSRVSQSLPQAHARSRLQGV
jgi:hypothetical protein